MHEKDNPSCFACPLVPGSSLRYAVNDSDSYTLKEFKESFPPVEVRLRVGLGQLLESAELQRDHGHVLDPYPIPVEPRHYWRCRRCGCAVVPIRFLPRRPGKSEWEWFDLVKMHPDFDQWGADLLSLHVCQGQKQ